MSASVLVVVSEPALRRSIEFVLGAEGYRVGSHTPLKSAQQAVEKTRVDCVVVDEEEVLGEPAGWELLRQIIPPVVLLAYRLREIPVIDGISVVGKPMLGGALVNAIRSALSGRCTQKGASHRPERQSGAP
jgi:DNA-binding response OmpR family regulator